MHGSEGPRPASCSLILMRRTGGEGRGDGDRERAWSLEAAHESQVFLVRRGHLLSDPSLATWVIEQCAELIVETASGELTWSALPLDALWRRLRNLQRFFPQPRLVVAHDETLRAFVPWLCGRGLLTPAGREEMLSELERVGRATLQRAQQELTLRQLGACPSRSES